MSSHFGKFFNKHKRADNRDAHLTPASSDLAEESAKYREYFLPTPDKHGSKEELKRVKELKTRIDEAGFMGIKDSQILRALRSTFADGDENKAFTYIEIMERSISGEVFPYQPGIKLLGAVNRNGTTCWMDSLLFAMFGRLDSFQAILYNAFPPEQAHKRRLAAALRLWVNLLRSGQLITVDITETVQKALLECGWTHSQSQQQDASEAFTFITDCLNLPLLTMKMDIYHEGQEDSADDHKFVNERLLEVAIPERPANGEKIKLEDCLEGYFNNRIDVMRMREQERRNSLKRRATNASAQTPTEEKGGASQHVEDNGGPSTQEIDFGHGSIDEVGARKSTFPGQSPPSPKAESKKISSIKAALLRQRSPSIIKKVNDPVRKGSMRNAVQMPAWQFFCLLPWYTENIPTNDAQVADHFSTKRPILGICLKRYGYSNEGNAIRLDTEIDIPIEIALPTFIENDQIDPEGPIQSEFKLMLQSIVCHKGGSVESGHYVSSIRATPLPGLRDSCYSDCDIPSTPEPSHWMRLDDLATDGRISLVNIDDALCSTEELPYLLFYQIVPINEENEEALPLYAANEAAFPDLHDLHIKSLPSYEDSRASTEITAESGRPSFEITSPVVDAGIVPSFDEATRGRPSSSPMAMGRKDSITFALDTITTSATVPNTHQHGVDAQISPSTSTSHFSLQKSNSDLLSNPDHDHDPAPDYTPSPAPTPTLPSSSTMALPIGAQSPSFQASLSRKPSSRFPSRDPSKSRSQSATGERISAALLKLGKVKALSRDKEKDRTDGGKLSLEIPGVMTPTQIYNAHAIAVTSSHSMTEPVIVVGESTPVIVEDDNVAETEDGKDGIALTEKGKEKEKEKEKERSRFRRTTRRDRERSKSKNGLPIAASSSNGENSVGAEKKDKGKGKAKEKEKEKENEGSEDEGEEREKEKKKKMGIPDRECTVM